MFCYENLDDTTRHYMLIEVEQAIKSSQLHVSRRFTGQGQAQYPKLLREAVRAGSEDSLTAALVQQQCFVEREPYGAGTRRVPANAARTFAEGQFNAFYMRGVCHRAIQAGQLVEVYRAKEALTPRPSSTYQVGQQLDPQQVLRLLRHSPSGKHRGAVVPAGFNSGLSLRIAGDSKG